METKPEEKIMLTVKQIEEAIANKQYIKTEYRYIKGGVILPISIEKDANGIYFVKYEFELKSWWNEHFDIGQSVISIYDTTNITNCENILTQEEFYNWAFEKAPLKGITSLYGNFYNPTQKSKSWSGTVKAPQPLIRL